LLSNNTAGEGRLHGRIKRQAIAYKTGTGPGGSDAWAIGTNGNYVVGIWIGSPKGEHVASNTGLGEAVPVMNRVFDGLPVGQLVQQVPQAAPEALANTDKTSNGLVIRFPVNGSVIEAPGNSILIPLVIDGANYPLLSINNGVKRHWITKELPNLNIAQIGSYNIVLIDAEGRTEKVSFVLR
jgi:penicillin-binding protein 1C